MGKRRGVGQIPSQRSELMGMELPLSLLWISLTLVLLYFLTKAAKKNSPSCNVRLPPGPAGLPVLGSLLEVGDQPHRSLARLAKTHGPVMALKLGLTTTVVVSSPAAAREALQKKDQPLSARWVPDAVRVFGHEQVSMIFGPASPSWKHLRAICSTHLFSVRSLDATRELRQQKARDLVAYVREHAGRPIDVGRALFGTVLNLISNTMFSFDMVDLHSESTQEFRDLVSALTSEVGKPNLSDFFPVLRIIDPQGRRRQIEVHLKKLFRVFDEIIDQRLSSNPTAAAAERGGDFLGALLQLHSQSKLDRKAIRSLLADLFAAGTDTSSIATEWAMAELLKNPSKLARVRKELEEAIRLPGQEVEESDIARLPYLQAVVKEVLRLHPPGPLLLPHRAAEAGVELGGYAVPEGAQVLVNVWAMGRDEEVWAEPEAFAPERFLGREVDFRGRDFELIPFGSGRRACPGLPLAVRTVHLLLASLLRSFEWRLPEGMAAADVDLSEMFGATLAMARPLRAVAVPVV